MLLTVLGKASCYAMMQEFSLEGENNLFWLQNLWSYEFRKICVCTSLSLLVKNLEYLYL